MMMKLLWLRLITLGLVVDWCAAGHVDRKARLLEHLRMRTFVRLQPSAIHGVGVFAIRPIPKGTDPFQVCELPQHNGFGRPQGERHTRLSQADVTELPPVVKKLVTDFIVPNVDRTYALPSRGMSTIDVSFYLNHSDTPNVDIAPSERQGSPYYGFRTTQDIPEGAELTIDIKKYVDQPAFLADNSPSINPSPSNKTIGP